MLLDDEHHGTRIIYDDDHCTSVLVVLDDDDDGDGADADADDTWRTRRNMDSQTVSMRSHNYNQHTTWHRWVAQKINKQTSKQRRTRHLHTVIVL